MTKRNKLGKTARILLAPALVFTFFIGWILYNVGDNKKAPTKRQTFERKEIEIMLMPPQEERMQTNQHEPKA